MVAVADANWSATVTPVHQRRPLAARRAVRGVADERVGRGGRVRDGGAAQREGCHEREERSGRGATFVPHHVREL